MRVIDVSAAAVVSTVLSGHGGLNLTTSRDGSKVVVPVATGGTPRDVALDRDGRTAVITNEADVVTVVR
jgi:hypothetical protein